MAAADPCAICLGEINRGQAVFVAECSHTFHHRCISDSVAHGNRDCPLCKATWRDLPAVDPVPGPAMPPPRAYADDDPVAQPAAIQALADGQVAAAAVVGEMALKTHCEFPAVARDASRDNFAVLVHARAPGPSAADAEAPRAPLDLVTVLDVSGSMSGNKLRLLKQAMRFVIDNLGPNDRLSVVSFSDSASREIRLTRMSDDGKASANHAVDSLVAGGSTDIGRGLRVASNVLAHRRYRNAVTSVILLSDGQDTVIGGRNFTRLVPNPFRAAGTRPGPIHTFGFGTDHDAAAMHTIAEVTGGTFSFIENLAVIQDAFAQCIGGLLSVVAQGARIAVECVHPGVRVRQVKSGHYESHVDDDGRAATVDVGELYAEEERRFLLFVDVPVAADASEDVTRLVKVRCTYRDVAAGRAADVVGDEAMVQRPAEVTNPQVSVEVERERVRISAAEEIVAARAAAERGAFQEAGRILQRQRSLVRTTRLSMRLDDDAEEEAGDEMLDGLEEELEDLGECMEDGAEYQRTGRARVLKGINSHAQQRASFVATRKCKSRRLSGGFFSRSGTVRDRDRERAPQPYMTTAMQAMLNKSKKSRDKQRTPSPPPTKRR
ncbi:unnamed protein product [Urochloa humidicola]